MPSEIPGDPRREVDQRPDRRGRAPGESRRGRACPRRGAAAAARSPPDRRACGQRPRRRRRRAPARARETRSARSRAALSIDVPLRFASPATSMRLDVEGHVERAASVAAESRSRVRLGAAQAVIEMRDGDDCRAPAADSSASRCASATESAPPDTAARTRVPCASTARRRRRVASTRAASERHELGRVVGGIVVTDSARRHDPTATERWCRCRDLNPGLRGYEPRALTN